MKGANIESDAQMDRNKQLCNSMDLATFKSKSVITYTMERYFLSSK